MELTLAGVVVGWLIAMIAFHHFIRVPMQKKLESDIRKIYEK